MEFPAEIRSEIEQLLAQEDTNQLAAAADEISRRYRGNDGSGKRLASGRQEIFAYAAVRMPATFGAVSRALELALEGVPEEQRFFRTGLDVGAGTGAATMAASIVTGCVDFRCIEREQEMLSLGKLLTEHCDIKAAWEIGDITKGFDGKAELVMCSYCLNELSQHERMSAVERLWDSTERLLLLVEPGTPEGYANIMAARERLISAGANIASPCPHEGRCLLPEGDWCHFTVRVARSRLHKQLKGGDVPYEDEKFCFLAASRGTVNPCSARVLRHPDIQSGRITLKLCTPDGIGDRMVTRKDPRFKSARKSDAGDSFAY